MLLSVLDYSHFDISRMVSDKMCIRDSLSSVQTQTPVYINSIIFGRMGIIAIESDYSYNELKTAFKAALTAGKVNGELNISTEYKDILTQSSMKIFVSGGKGQDVAKIVEGYDEFKNFIINGGEFTRDIPGVPIFFTANYVHNNSVFSTTSVSYTHLILRAKDPVSETKKNIETINKYQK